MCVWNRTVHYRTQNNPTKNDSENWGTNLERNCRGLVKSIELSRSSHRVTEETPDQRHDSQFSSAHFGRVHSAHIWHFTTTLICSMTIFASLRAKTQLRLETTFQSIRHDVLYAYTVYYILPVVWDVANGGQNKQDPIKAKYWPVECLH